MKAILFFIAFCAIFAGCGNSYRLGTGIRQKHPSDSGIPLNDDVHLLSAPRIWQQIYNSGRKFVSDRFGPRNTDPDSAIEEEENRDPSGDAPPRENEAKVDESNVEEDTGEEKEDTVDIEIEPETPREFPQPRPVSNPVPQKPVQKPPPTPPPVAIRPPKPVKTPAPHTPTPPRDPNALPQLLVKQIKERGDKWVSSRVPYSQQRRRDNYRTDCSGFVSFVRSLSPRPSHFF
jgi:hypothetical protein